MYKITIKKSVGEVVKEMIIETDDLELTKEILVSEEIIQVETDVPNESIDPNVTKLREIWKQQIEDIWKNPQIPYTPSNPFTVTC